MNGIMIGGAAELAGLQEVDFAFDGSLAGAESDPCHQLMRERLQFGARYILRQIERDPQKPGDDFVQNVGAWVESGFVGVRRGRRTKGAKGLHGDPDIHAKEARRLRAGLG